MPLRLSSPMSTIFSKAAILAGESSCSARVGVSDTSSAAEISWKRWPNRMSLAHTTIMRWVRRHAPESEKRWNRFARQVRGSWRVDETYRKSSGVGHISAAPWTKPERPWISSFAPSETVSLGVQERRGRPPRKISL